MFGHVLANEAALGEAERQRYRAAYCGLCHALGEQHGAVARLGLSYDLTFLLLLLSSLYEPAEQPGKSRCLVHPLRCHDYVVSDCSRYAADMTVLLCFHKAMDDWKDERNFAMWAYAAQLRRAYDHAAERWPRQCSAIQWELEELERIESVAAPLQADEGAAAFGRLMEELFVWRQDRWEPELRTIGHGLGRFIYLADAAVDYRSDRKKNRFNPLLTAEIDPHDLRTALEACLGGVSAAFHRLPLVQDEAILGNILYSGLWTKYNKSMKECEA